MWHQQAFEGNCETLSSIGEFWKGTLGLLKWGREGGVKKSSEKYDEGHNPGPLDGGRVPRQNGEGEQHEQSLKTNGLLRVPTPSAQPEALPSFPAARPALALMSAGLGLGELGGWQSVF